MLKEKNVRVMFIATTVTRLFARTGRRGEVGTRRNAREIGPVESMSLPLSYEAQGGEPQVGKGPCEGRFAPVVSRVITFDR